MDILQELLGPLSVDEFLHRHFTRIPCAMPNRAARYTQAFTAADFAALVEGPQSVLRVVQNGRLLHDHARLSWAEAQAQHRRGHTLLVRYAERSCTKLQMMAEAFAQFFHSPVDIQVYLTPGQHQAFGWHYDLEEVFIIQVQGCKEYTLRQNTVHPLPVWDTMPADLHFERETSRLRLTCRLEAGDWLYIPSGWWHIARTQAESIHLSIGVMPVTRLKLFDFLKHQLAHSPFWCERLALVPPAAADSPAPLGKDDRLWGEMRAQLTAMLAQEDTFQAFLAYLVDAKRAWSVESPAFHPAEAPPPTAAPLTAPAPSLQV